MDIMLIQHIRHGDKLIGTIVALDKDVIGWSQCCPKDKFDKKRGIEIARGRALKGTRAIPARIKFVDDIDYVSDDGGYFIDIIADDIIGKYVEIMRKRADKYFQEDYHA